MTTRDKLIERVAAVLVPDMDPTDTMVQVDTEARAAAIVDALGLVEVCDEYQTTIEELATSGCVYPVDAAEDGTVAACIKAGVCGCRNEPAIERARTALSKLRGDQS